MAELEQFVDYMNNSRAVSEDSHIIDDEDRPEENDSARNRFKERAYKEGVKRGDIDPAIVPDVGQWNASDNDIKGYNLSIQKDLRQEAAKALASNLEKIVGQIEDSKLEPLARSKDIADAAGSDYADWRNHYMAYLNAKELAQKADEGRISDKEREMLRAPAAQAAAEETRKAYAKKGFDIGRQELASQLTYAAAIRGWRDKDAEKIGAEKLVEETEKALRDYEAGSKKDLRSYVTEGFKKLGSKGSNTDNFNKARDLIYGAATGTLKLKEE